MIRNHVAELLEKYTFITKAEIKGAYLHLYYKSDTTYGMLKISTRATKKMLIEIIEKLKKDIGYYDDKKVRDAKVRESLEKDRTRPLIFANR